MQLIMSFFKNCLSQHRGITLISVWKVHFSENQIQNDKLNFDNFQICCGSVRHQVAQYYSCSSQQVSTFLGRFWRYWESEYDGAESRTGWQYCKWLSQNIQFIRSELWVKGCEFSNICFVHVSKKGIMVGRLYVMFLLEVKYILFNTACNRRTHSMWARIIFFHNHICYGWQWVGEW